MDLLPAVRAMHVGAQMVNYSQGVENQDQIVLGTPCPEDTSFQADTKVF